VSADGSLFNETIVANITYKNSSAGKDEIEKTILAAGLEHTIARLPLRLDTMVGENGIGLSVGERQRIQIARILLAGPKILILDEATANLDYATEAEIKRSIQEIRRNSTVIVIAHRFSMVRDADQVIVLNDGKLIESGTPEELIALNGWFSEFSKANVDEAGDEEPDEND